MRPFYTMLLALAIVVLCSDVATKVVTANGGGAAATVTLMDCKVLLTIPGKCTPRSAWTTARVASAVPVGECVADGCRCTYCTVPPRGRRN
ncbi:hypothetical protein ZWY2020_025880 [Hordeum vulgare]|nr:hypothetical protein ZWY2020_025880 [Hordeum vulgare]